MAASATVPFEIYAEQMSALERQNLAKRNAFFANSGRIAPAPGGDVLPLAGVLGPGRYPGGTLADGADLTGLGLPSIGPMTIPGAAIVRGCILAGQLTVQNGATVRIEGCRIDVPIVVDAGGRLVVLSSVFKQGAAFIANAGAAVNCASVGNVGWAAGTPHINVTLVNEV